VVGGPALARDVCHGYRAQYAPPPRPSEQLGAIGLIFNATAYDQRCHTRM
jgi:hypothetical protein